MSLMFFMPLLCVVIITGLGLMMLARMVSHLHSDLSTAEKIVKHHGIELDKLDRLVNSLDKHVAKLASDLHYGRHTSASIKQAVADAQAAHSAALDATARIQYAEKQRTDESALVNKALAIVIDNGFKSAKDVEAIRGQVAMAAAASDRAEKSSVNTREQLGAAIDKIWARIAANNAPDDKKSTEIKSPEFDPPSPAAFEKMIKQKLASIPSIEPKVQLSPSVDLVASVQPPQE